MKTIILAAAAALLAPAAWAQTGPTALQVEIPELPTAVADPTCGGRTALTLQAFCVMTTQASVAGLVDAYSEAFSRQQWIPAGGEDNRVIYVRRRPGGGCDGFQMMAFADPNRVPGPAEPAYLAFGNIPGDVCATTPVTTPAPAQ